MDEKKKYNEALECYEEALRIKSALGNSSATNKDHKQLMDCFEGALEAVSKLFGEQDLRYAKLLHQKGNFHGAKGEHSLAIEAYVETLRIYKQEYGDSHLSVANTLFNLGVALNEKGSPGKALRCFLKALRITKARLGDDHLDVADTYEQMATAHRLMLSYMDATSYYEKALRVKKQLVGDNDLKSAAIMHEMGKLYCEEENWDKAERAFKESLRIRKVQLGEDDTLVAESMHQLGTVYKCSDENTKALQYFEGSLRINKSKLDPPTNSQTADDFFSLGGVHSALGNISKAIFCYDKAIAVYGETVEQYDEKVVLSIARKGDVLRVEGKYQDALSCFSECLERTKLMPESASLVVLEERAYSLCEMAEIYSVIDDATNATSSFALALSEYRQLFGSNHPAVANVLQKMSIHFIKVKEFERGYSCVKEALAIRQGTIGTDEIETADSHYCMGKILFEWSNYSDSRRSFECARDIHLKKLGGGITVANSNFYLGCISEINGDFDSAVHYLQESLVGRKDLLDELDSELADTYSRLGLVYCKRSEWDNAVDCFSNTLKIREANRGTDASTQVLVADSLYDLGTALSKALDTKRSKQLFTDALNEYQLHLDKSHLKIAKCYSSLGEVYEKENELSKAIQSLEKASAIYERNFGSAEPRENEIKASKLCDDYTSQAETLFNLATAYDRLDEESTSLKLYRRAMKLYKALFGKDSLLVAKVLNRLANMKGRAGSVDKAMVLFDESLRIRMLHLGNNHEDVAETLFGMGIVFEKRRDYGAAMKAYSHCCKIRRSRFGSDSMEVAQVIVNIGVVRGNKGDFTEALKSWNKALAIYRKHGLEDSDALVSTVIGHQSLATVLIENRGKKSRKKYT